LFKIHLKVIYYYQLFIANETELKTLRIENDKLRLLNADYVK